MVKTIPPYRVYNTAFRRSRCSLGVSESPNGAVWATVTDRRSGETSLLALPSGVELDLSGVPPELARAFTGEFLMDMVDNFL